MAKSLFTSDLHLGHKSIAKHRPLFSSVEEHDRYMLDLMWQLTKHDTLTVLGDFIFDSDYTLRYLAEIARMPVQIKLILGNHDYLGFEHYLAAGVKFRAPLVQHRNFWLSHCPIHPDQMRGLIGNVHGHIHDESLPDPRYFNVNIDVNEYQFVSLDQIKDHYAS